MRRRVEGGKFQVKVMGLGHLVQFSGVQLLGACIVEAVISLPKDLQAKLSSGRPLYTQYNETCRNYAKFHNKMTCRKEEGDPNFTLK